jgi:hypothetical protein
MHSNFYNELRVIDSFRSVSDSSYYRDAPGDWWVLITDVKGSTKAIEEGRYKDVNQLGVATITFVKNLLPDENFLFVFGGDGATLLLSDRQYNKIKSRLASLQQLAVTRFKLELRVGAIQVQEVLQYQCCIRVALLEINDKQHIAVFQGGGLIKAEEIIKNREYTKQNIEHSEEPQLQGLSCRWQPLPSKNGIIASVIISCRDTQNSTHVFKEVITGIYRIFDGNLDRANPVNIIHARYKGIPRLIRDEVRLHQNIFTKGFGKRVLEIIFCVLCFKFAVPLFESRNYIAAIPDHSDYKKFDDTMRMVLDGTVAQIRELNEFLENLYQQNKVFYGVHESPEALMTCLVEGLADGEHIHFIDGSDGGYAIAARKMKAQASA